MKAFRCKQNVFSDFFLIVAVTEKMQIEYIFASKSRNFGSKFKFLYDIMMENKKNQQIKSSVKNTNTSLESRLKM